MTRRIVQISAWTTEMSGGTDVLCDDGSIWGLSSKGEWMRYADIPQDTPAESPDPIAELEAMGGRLHPEYYALAWMLHTPGREPDVEIEGVTPEAASGMIALSDLRAAAARLLERVRGGE